MNYEPTFMHDSQNPREFLIRSINNNLLDFYDFHNKIIITIGAGGGQVIEYGFKARKVFAIDNSEEAIKKLNNIVLIKGLNEKFMLLHSDFLQTSLTGDLVFFEFSLHEMTDPRIALEHAFSMAPEILIADHWPGSEWAYFTDEDEKIKKSWNATISYPGKKIRQYNALQFFNNYDELYQKVKGQGMYSISRINKYKEGKNFSIPMAYGFIILKRLVL